MSYFFKALAFSGRASKKEFIIFHLLKFILAVIVSGIGAGIGYYVAKSTTGVIGKLIIRITGGVEGIAEKTSITFLSLFLILMYIPSTALAIRRLHDVSKSGWNLLIVYIPWLSVLYLYNENLLYITTPTATQMTTTGWVSLSLFMITFIYILILFLKKGVKDTNKYNEVSKELSTDNDLKEDNDFKEDNY